MALRIAETALLAKVPVKQISRLRLGEDCPEIRESTIQRMRKYIALIRDGEDRSNRWQRIAWFLERRYPDRWAKPEVLLNINSSGANVTNNTLVITAEQAQGLRNRNATIDEALSKLSPPSARAAMTDVMTNVMTNDSASPKSLEIKAGASNCELLAEEFLPNKEHAEKTLSSSVVLAEGATAPARTPDAGAGESEPKPPPKSKSVENSSNYRTGIDPKPPGKPGAKKQEKNLENFNPPGIEKPQSLGGLAPLQSLDKKPRSSASASRGRPRRGTENVPLPPAPRGPKSGRK